jgi:hypothetical protein
MADHKSESEVRFPLHRDERGRLVGQIGGGEAEIVEDEHGAALIIRPRGSSDAPTEPPTQRRMTSRGAAIYQFAPRASLIQ